MGLESSDQGANTFIASASCLMQTTRLHYDSRAESRVVKRLANVLVKRSLNPIKGLVILSDLFVSVTTTNGGEDEWI
jgi:hypothetical protein